MVLLTGLRRLLADFYAIEGIDDAFLMTAMVVALYGFSSPGVIAFQREMQFGHDFLFEAGSVLVRVVLSIALVLYFRSFYGVLWALILAAFFRMFLSYLMTRRIKLSFGRAAIFEIFRISKWAGLETIATTLYINFDRLILGKTGTSRYGRGLFCGNGFGANPTSDDHDANLTGFIAGIASCAC